MKKLFLNKQSCNGVALHCNVCCHSLSFYLDYTVFLTFARFILFHFQKKYFIIVLFYYNESNKLLVCFKSGQTSWIEN